MIGQTVSHYQITEQLGQGGMGVVYKATDTKLGRTVALKFLPRHTLGTGDDNQRFHREARAAAQLNHPNICTIHEIDEAEGQTFIAMEFVEGETLAQKIKQGPLTLNAVIDMAVQVAAGLQAAHERGIIHRDVKTSNVMVTDRALVKIVDFGLAKVAAQTPLTKTGSTLGTVAYMSPEQARGEAVDQRTDLWSLGVVLYEMLTGQRPFRGDYEQAIVYSLLNVDPEPLTALRPKVPGALEQIVSTLLEKEPDERYANMNALLVDLRRLQQQVTSEDSKAPEARPAPSIAVLPFVNMSADPEQEYFCDGMAEELINALTHVEGLHVVARTSAFSFKGRHIDVREIGHILNVETVLDGSVRKAGTRLRITAQLIKVADGYHMWSERYDRELEDVFAIQDEISLAIVEALKVQLLEEQKAALAQRYTDDLEAYNLYLKGRFYLNQRGPALGRALEYFQQAIDRDAQFPLAHAGLAEAYIFLAVYALMPPVEALPHAKQAATRALALNDRLPEAHVAAGLFEWFYNWNTSRAEKAIAQALELNPGHVNAHYQYGAYLLYTTGRFEEARAHLRRAIELDPFWAIAHAHVGICLIMQRDYQEAVVQLQQAVEIDPNFFYTHWQLGHANQFAGRYPEALAAQQVAVRVSRRHPCALYGLAAAHAAAGQQAAAENILEELHLRSRQDYVSPSILGFIYLALGKKDEAFIWLERAREERDTMLSLFWRNWPGLDPLRGTSRFDALLKKAVLER